MIAEPGDILDIRVKATFVDGQLAYGIIEE